MKKIVYKVLAERYNPQLGTREKIHDGTLDELTEKLNIKTKSKTIQTLINKANKKQCAYGSMYYRWIED